MPLAHLLFNPKAGRGTGEQTSRTVAEALEGAGWTVALQPTQGPGDATRLGAEAHGVADRLVVVGGDGTLREAAEGVLAEGGELELGFVPRGNANVVARDLGIPLSLEGAVRCLLSGQSRRIDTFRANGTFVLAMVGLGMDARITHSVTRARTGRLGGWYRVHADSLYGVLGGAALLGRYPSRMRIEVDGALLAEDVRHAVISNLRTYAKGWAMSPAADPTDGLLDVAARRTSGPLPALAQMLLAARHRNGPDWLVKRRQGARVLVTSRGGPLEWQADGDPQAPTERLELEVQASCLALVAPRC